MRLLGWLRAAPLLAALACGQPRPFPIVMGQDPCDHCHMTLADRRFVAELVTRTGKQYRFDDIGCLAAFLANEGSASAAGASAWVGDFLHPGQWLRADSATYLRSEALHTPMASGLIALGPGAPVDSVRTVLAATVLAWPEVKSGAELPRQ